MIAWIIVVLILLGGVALFIAAMWEVKDTRLDHSQDVEDHSEQNDPWDDMDWDWPS